MTELDDSGYDTTRKAVIWVSLAICIETFLDIHVSEVIPHLEGAKDWKICLVMMFIIGYLTFRLLQFTLKENKFVETFDVLDDLIRQSKLDAIKACKDLLISRYENKINENQILVYGYPSLYQPNKEDPYEVWEVQWHCSNIIAFHRNFLGFLG